MLLAMMGGQHPRHGGGDILFLVKEPQEAAFSP